MPLGVKCDSLSRLSAATEATIDDAGLYLRNISDGLKQSRTNWEIQDGRQSEFDRAKETKGPADMKGSKRKTRELSEDDTEPA
jgi:hypothetical protein